LESCGDIVYGKWEMVKEIKYSRSTVNSKGYYYLTDLNVYGTVLKASSSVFYRKDFDCMYYIVCTYVNRVKVSQGKIKNCEEQKKKCFWFDFQESRKM